jgi:tellurite resistance-related uncharacterized protein
MPASAVPYRKIGPFDAASLPAGLLAEHRLKEGVWGKLEMLDGSLDFVWDDGRQDDRCRICAGDVQIVTPTTPHHLETSGPFRLTIEFWK